MDLIYTYTNIWQLPNLKLIPTHAAAFPGSFPNLAFYSLDNNRVI